MERTRKRIFGGTSRKCAYSPLSDPKKEIRIATIYPARNPDSPIRCGLPIYTLLTAPAYEALSYCWGDENNKEVISLQGEPHEVTTNLFAALRQLRNRFTKRMIWIDAICINQSDHNEKYHQITLMGQIYSQAKSVIVWLGEADEDTHLACELLKAWILITRDIYNSQPVVEDVLDKISGCLDERAWAALYNILHRPYWNRMWTLQEYVLAAEVIFQCGRHKLSNTDISWIMFMHVKLMYTNYRKYAALLGGQRSMIKRCFNDEVASLIALRQRRLDGKSQPTELFPDYPDLLSFTSHKKCRDPRDKLFATLGLAAFNQSSREIPVEPDYGQSVAITYRAFTTSLICTTRTLDILPLAGLDRHGSELHQELPSWVPDLTYESHSYHLRKEANASEFSKAQCVILEELGELHTSGIICDAVTECEDLHGADVRRELQRIAKFAPKRRHPTGIPWRQALFRTMIKDGSGYGYGRPDFKSLDEEKRFCDLAVGFIANIGRVISDECEFPLHTTFNRSSYVDCFYLWARGAEAWAVATGQQKRETFLQEFCGTSDSTQGLRWSFSEPSERLNELRRLIINEWRANSMFITENGYIGIYHASINTGDQVCVLPGCHFPLLVRQVRDHYLLLGYCCVYGMMKGEMMQEVRDGKLKFQNMVFK